MTAEPVILFDGECSLCNGSVLFVLKRERAASYRFASLQSEAGQRLLRRHGYPLRNVDTFILIEDNHLFTRSDAALRVTRRLRAPWPFLSLFSIVPCALRDCGYDFIAARRYRWFGKAEFCCSTRHEFRCRFLQDEPDNVAP